MLLNEKIPKPNLLASYDDRKTNPRPRRLSKKIPKVIRADTENNRFEIFKGSLVNVRKEYLNAFYERECEGIAKYPKPKTFLSLMIG